MAPKAMKSLKRDASDTNVSVEEPLWNVAHDIIKHISDQTACLKEQIKEAKDTSEKKVESVQECVEVVVHELGKLYTQQSNMAKALSDLKHQVDTVEKKVFVTVADLDEVKLKLEKPRDIETIEGVNWRKTVADDMGKVKERLTLIGDQIDAFRHEIGIKMDSDAATSLKNFKRLGKWLNDNIGDQ